MKVIITFVFIIFIGAAAQAQNNPEVQKVATPELELVSIEQIQQNIQKENTEMVRLYRRADYRVKKALSFSTKRDSGIA